MAQTVDLTPNTAAVRDLNPFVPRTTNPQSELPVVFQSNRSNLAGSTVLGTGNIYHIYRMEQDGSGVTAITGPLAPADNTGALIGVNSSQTDPAFDAALSAVVFVDKGAAVELYELRLSTRRLTGLLRNNPSGLSFTDVQNPEYLSAEQVMFAGKTTADSHWHLYIVHTVTLNVTQLTTGVADDMNPTLSPDRNLIAFDSNRANAAGTATKSNRDIWVTGVNPNFPNAARVTNFAAGTASDNVEPSWSTNQLDQSSIVRRQQLLAFATNRVDTAGNGVPNAVGATHDIYWLKVNIIADPLNAGVFTIEAPEDSTANPAYKLTTSDPQHIYDDRHPAWPQFITSYRVTYHSDRTFHNPATLASGPAGAPQDIFASTLIDINAPTLIRADETVGDIVSVTPRISTGGSTVTIKVKLADLESGMPRNDPVYGDGVFVQIKNPNSKYQSADGLEHKVYTFRSVTPNDSNYLSVPVEYESEPIFIGSDPTDPQFNSYPRASALTAVPPVYLPGDDDFFAFSGTAHEPWERWLPLKFESRDPATGIATYSATWQTPAVPSDYYVDVIAYDQSLNPFTRTGGDTGMNWKIYDNVYGFTTQTFQAANNILFVSDNSAGQKFFQSRFGNDTLQDVRFTFWGTESWLTDIDVRLLPTVYDDGVVSNALNALGVRAYSDGNTDDGTRIDGSPVPATTRYDIWRVLSRGPVPDSVLAQYLPHQEQQPADVIAGEATPRTVTVAPRCVFWNAPYTGDVFANPGTITDLTVQTQLTSFLAAGGRLLVNGQDIAWALTLGGQVPSTFLSSALRAAYVRDFAPNTAYLRLIGAGAPNPVSNEVWNPYPPYHNFPISPTDPHGTMAEETGYVYPGDTDAQNERSYGCPGVQYSDAVSLLSGAAWDFCYNNTAGGDVAMLHYSDTASTARVVYAPVGFEGINTECYIDNSVMVLRPRRSWISHNAACWMRTGTIIGRVIDLEAGNPMGGVLVRLTHVSGAPSYTAITRDDGSYTASGLESGAYNVSAIYPGYTIQKPTGAVTHGGYRSDVSFRMTKAEPAVIQGRVTRMDGTTPVVGATVTATDVLTGAVFTGTTDADGNYTIDRVPASTKYTLTATAPGFGTSVPVSYTVPDATLDPGDTVVVPAKTYDEYDFQLRAEPGSVTGYVYARNADGTRGAPIAGATVTATLGSMTVTATTDANGQYTFNAANNPPNGLDPGLWALVATAPGYAPNSPAVQVTVTTGQNTTAPEILLATTPPGSLSGLVTRTSDNAPLSGVTVTLTGPAGNVVATTTTGAAQTDGTGYRYNYRFASVPAGVTYTVTAALTGFTSVPASASAAVTSGVETKSVNFALEPLHTFQGNLSLVSAPYDYTGRDVATLLSVPPADVANKTFVFATWEFGKYVFYPTPPADTFRLGRGYFLGYRTNLPLSTEGTAAPTDRPFDIRLNPGWNLIGDPFLLEIDWTKVDVVNSTGQVVAHDQAVAQGLIGAALYTYASGGYVLDFKLSPWRGYWVRAYSTVTLRIDPTTDVYGRAAREGGTSRAILGGGNGWSVNLRASVAGMNDNDNHFGVSSTASDGFDGYKLEKPPAFTDRYIRLTFDHDTWGERSGGYGVDVRSSKTTSQAWNFTVDTTESNQAVTLTWPNAAVSRRDVTVTLVDVATGARRDMRSNAAYTWRTGSSAEPRKFRVEVTRATRNRLAVTGLVARPAANRSGGINISYNLSTAAEVEVRILSGSGAAVRSLSGRASRAAGVNQAVWDQKNDRAVAVPSGTYVVEVRARSTDGAQTVRTAVPVVVTR